MSFTSYTFIFIFLPVSISAFYLAKKHHNTISKNVLIVSGLAFCLFGGMIGFICFLLSIGLNWLFLLSITRSQESSRKKWLITGIVSDCLFLAFFKYAYAGIGGVILPLGISFYTFQNIALLVAVYNDKEQVRNLAFTDFLVYETYFPKLAQGPITMPESFFSQIEGSTDRKAPDWERMSKGFFLFSMGLAKKTMLADKFGLIADAGFSSVASLNSLSSIVAVLAYTIQIYFDFSGYSDMALGISKMMGIDLPINFNSPYKSVNISDFWKRWHISLTYFLTHYIYIPLGGNRKGKTRTYINILIVFIVSGIWHGAGLSFIIWGLIHGLAMVVYRCYKDCFPETHFPFKRISALFGWFLTMACVVFSWIFFRASSLSDALLVIKNILKFDFGGLYDAFQPLLQPALARFLIPQGILRYIAYFVIDGVVPFWALFIAKNSNEIVDSFNPGIRTVVITVLLFAGGIISMTGIQAFVYSSF